MTEYNGRYILLGIYYCSVKKCVRKLIRSFIHSTPLVFYTRHLVPYIFILPSTQIANSTVPLQCTETESRHAIDHGPRGGRIHFSLLPPINALISWRAFRDNNASLFRVARVNPEEERSEVTFPDFFTFVLREKRDSVANKYFFPRQIAVRAL